MDIMSLATELNLVGKLVYNVLYKWADKLGIYPPACDPFENLYTTYSTNGSQAGG